MHYVGHIPRRAESLPQVGLQRTGPRQACGSWAVSLVLTKVYPKVCPQCAWRRARGSISLAGIWRNAGLYA